MKNSRTLRAVLSLALIAVFAGVFYEVKDAVTVDNNRISPESIDTGKVSRNRPFYVYQPDAKDPFRLEMPAAKALTSQKPKVKPPAWSPPPYTLNGTVINGARRIAVVESSGGKISFLSEGESLDGLAILRIDKDSVHFSYGGQKGSWRLR